VARKSGAEAVHPGYGFLSENAAFAEACAKAGLIFIGPPAAAIRAMGDKAASKALMEQAGVPVVPGYHGDDQAEAMLAKEARRIGFPVLIKASAGGGGKGMRVVERAADFAAALASAKREASGAFGDDRVLVEKYLMRPRHIEVQVFADGKGNTVHLFERDCSIQRRYQKVVEEAPAPGIAEALRQALTKAAVAAAKAVGYVGAGTVEFIVSGDFFAFMEMNTRLQVEHPVTEAITGFDLVEWQFRVAAGEALPKTQKEIAARGHGIEARLYAEDPARDFLPATGRLEILAFPESRPGLRVDTGVRQGDRIGIHYDPLIAKVIVWGEDRAAAVGRLGAALAELRIAGLTTNREFLYRLATSPAYRTGELDTGFIARYRAALLPPIAPAPAAALAAASLARVLDQQESLEAPPDPEGDPWSPWRRRDGWRLNGATFQEFHWRDTDTDRSVRVRYSRDGYGLEIDGMQIAAGGAAEAGGWLALTLDGQRKRVAVLRHESDITVLMDGLDHRLRYIDSLAAKASVDDSGGRLTAPMPGKVMQVMTQTGARVKRGQALLVLEAMKMEHTIAAPADGTVEGVHYAAGDLVEEGAALIAFAAAGGEDGDAPAR
jgi:3-methylcrotonyl-CoA carboxylase alpha subunit